MTLKLSAAFSVNPMTVAIHEGRVHPAGVQWHVSAMHPSEMFWRQLRFAEFDISEMSLSSLAIATAKGSRDWVAVPVFTTRRFFHTGIVVRDDAGIRRPEDLAGHPVGVPEYQQTAAVWTRAALQREFGVRPDQMTWFMERSPETSHGGATDFRPPPGVVLEHLPDGASLQEFLALGKVDACIVYIAANNLVDRSRASAAALPGVRPLFDDPVAEGIRYFRATGILPVNHCVVVRASLVERHPWLPLNVYAALVDAKDSAQRAYRDMRGAYEMLGMVTAGPGAGPASGDDPLPYGIRGQRQTLEALLDHVVEQGLAPRRVRLEELFGPSTLDV